MVKLRAPALSLGASGSIGGALVFAEWKGRPYARQLVIPANPKSGGQVGMRAMFQFLTQKWDALTAGNKATWEDRADQGTVSPFNAYCGYNMRRWRNFLAPTKEDPEDTAMTPCTPGTLAAVAGVRSITVTQPITTASDGWGVLFFRSDSGTFDSAFDNLRKGVLIAATADVIFVDSPLAAGTYYYEIRTVTGDGQLSTASAEVDATVT